MIVMTSYSNFVNFKKDLRTENKFFLIVHDCILFEYAFGNWLTIVE